jgi:uncharacterized surface protein with fasciclin (FAS1) repeats
MVSSKHTDGIGGSPQSKRRASPDAPVESQLYFDLMATTAHGDAAFPRGSNSGEAPEMQSTIARNEAKTTGGSVGACGPLHRLPSRVVITLVTWVIVPVALGACGRSAERPATYPDGTIAAILASDDRFDTLMEITEQDMPPVALDSFTAPELDITLFAPTDDAFAALSPEALDWLRNDNNVSDLQRVFDHHVLRMAHSLGDLRSKVQAGDGEVVAIDESPIRLTLVNGMLRVDGATVVEGDIEAVNGVIHVIDAVIIPDSVSIP